MGRVGRYSNQKNGWTQEGQGTTGDINRGEYWLSQTPSTYKLSDHEIREAIGQPDSAKSGASEKKSKFSYMSDQSYVNTYYSYNNREYFIMKDYTARWRFYWRQVVPESTTTTTLTSYYWSSNYNGRSTGAIGEGVVNWRGNPICGKSGGAGINCSGERTGAPQKSPSGGRGCNHNPSRNRWASTLTYYMCQTNYNTYAYFCNGAQHTSSFSFTHRFWFRSPDENQVA